MTGAINVHFPALKEWIESYIKDVFTKVKQRNEWVHEIYMH